MRSSVYAAMVFVLGSALVVVPAGPSGYLVGDAFTVADLTAAALLSPLTFPPEYPYATPPLPPVVRQFQERYAKRPAFDWVREMYRRHRGTSAGIEG